jgi:hypothetical protein
VRQNDSKDANGADSSQAGADGGGGGRARGGDSDGDSESEEEPVVSTPRVGARDGGGEVRLPRTSAPCARSQDLIPSASPRLDFAAISCGYQGGEGAIQTPLASFKLGGHAPFLDVAPPVPEPLSMPPPGSSHADLVVRALVSEAERLMSTPRPAAPPTATGGAPAPAPLASISAAGGAANAAGFPRVVYDAYPADGGSPHAGALPEFRAG